MGYEWIFVTIEKLLGHRDLNMTMVYARVHDRTVADDYYAAMKWIEQGLNLALVRPPPSNGHGPISQVERVYLLELIGELAEPDLEPERRLKLVAQMRRMLSGETLETELENQSFEMIAPAVSLDAVAPVP